MAFTGNMNFFKVNQCGLYKIGKAEPNGIELEETFDSLMKWASTRSMSATLPWDAAHLSSRSKCYLKDIYKDEATGDFLLILWKSDTNSSGGIWGAAEDGEMGAGEVIEYTNEYKGKKVIWGKPCYYWVIPKLKSVVSIKFDHSVCDSRLFQDFVMGCVNNRIPHSGRVKATTERGFTRISHAEGDDLYRYTYRFEVSLRSLETSNVEFEKFAQSITHIIRRETIPISVKNERADWVKKFNESLPFASAKPKSSHRQIEIKAEARPTANEVKDIIEKYALEERKQGTWDNVGFFGDTGLTWVDRYRLKDEIIINGYSNSVLTASFLYAELAKNRNRFIAPVLKSVEEEMTSEGNSQANAA
jgi:hypothetical protein